MAFTVIVHLLNEEYPVVGEVDQLPGPADQSIRVREVRRRDGCPVSFVDPGTKVVIFPWTCIHCVEVLPDGQ